MVDKQKLYVALLFLFVCFIHYVYFQSFYQPCKCLCATEQPKQTTQHHQVTPPPCTPNTIVVPQDVAPKEKSMGELMIEAGTDKVDRHAYDRYYEQYFAAFRHKADVSIMEIGANNGNSILLWAKYFSTPAHIHSIAYAAIPNSEKMACDAIPEKCQVIRIFDGDQSDVSFLRTIANKYAYDIIIDDGSHNPEHQIISFSQLFPALRPGGLYVIEDLETSYWSSPTGASIYGYDITGAGIGRKSKFNAVEKFKSLIDVLMRYHMTAPEMSVMPADSGIFSITFGQGLVIVHKSTEQQKMHLPNIPSAPVDLKDLEKWISQNQWT